MDIRIWLGPDFCANNSFRSLQCCTNLNADSILLEMVLEILNTQVVGLNLEGILIINNLVKIKFGKIDNCNLNDRGVDIIVGGKYFYNEERENWVFISSQIIFNKDKFALAEGLEISGVNYLKYILPNNFFLLENI